MLVVLDSPQEDINLDADFDWSIDAMIRIFIKREHRFMSQLG